MANQNVSVQVRMEGKSMIVAYLLWWFLGWAGIHRFYLGRIGSGVAQLVLFVVGLLTTIFLVGYLVLAVWSVWWLLDAFLTYKIVGEENARLGISASTLSVSQSGGIHNELEQLERLHALYEKGVLTQEQYEAKKAALV